MLKKEKRLIFERDKIFEQLIENKDWIIGSIIETERVQSGRKQLIFQKRNCQILKKLENKGKMFKKYYIKLLK